jgi:3,4-dihydroxy 2-butanone 4-phosphate synthase / GTP cyclohydrolase II
MEIAGKFNLKIITIKDLIAFRLQTESIVIKGVEVTLPTKYGNFKLIPFIQESNGLEHIALIKGNISRDEPILTRVHSSCMTGDIFGSYRCDCGAQLHRAMEMIEKEGKGVLIYMNQEGRGIGLFNKIRAYKLQEQGRDTVEANIDLGFKEDERDYGVGANILRELGLGKLNLITNNPIKRAGLEGYGLTINENVPLVIEPNEHNAFYLKTKQDKMGHFLDLAQYNLDQDK